MRRSSPKYVNYYVLDILLFGEKGRSSASFGQAPCHEKCTCPLLLCGEDLGNEGDEGLLLEHNLLSLLHFNYHINHETSF